eukprot:13838075-Alexandrium_andersonii.AAC.1
MPPSTIRAILGYRHGRDRVEHLRWQTYAKEVLDGTHTHTHTEYRSNRVAPALTEHAKIASPVRTWNCAGPETA